MAARLMAHARESAVQVDATTQRKVSHEFSTVLVGNEQLKGISRAVPIYRVQTESRQVRSLLIKGQGEIVGRRAELDTLRQSVEESISGAGRICVVSGEAGIGKSRLSSRLVELAELHGALTLYGICYSYETFTPFFPWKEVLVQAFQFHESDGPEERLERIRRAFARLEGVGPEWVAVVAGIMGLSVVEDELTAALDARQKNQHVFNIIHQLLVELSGSMPLLLFFEDLHWADRISLDLIEYVATRISPLRMTLLVTRFT